MKERFGAKNAESMKLRTHAQTAGVSLTAQQPYNNVVRVALQALAAVLGGTQSLHTNSLDETYALPTEEAVTIALRTQQIIADESGVANTIDPLGGSYFVEWLTDKHRGRGARLHPPHRRDGRHGRARSRRATRSARSRRSAYRFQRAARGRRARDGRREQATRRRRDDANIPLLRIDEEVQKHADRRTSREVKADARRGEGAARRSPRCARPRAGQDEPDAADHRRGEGVLHASRRSATCCARCSARTPIPPSSRPPWRSAAR